MSVAVVLVAAGNGERLGLGLPKALVLIDGKTILEHSLEAVSSFQPEQLVVVAHEDRVLEFQELVQNSYPGKFSVVPGGSSRQGSVANGLQLVEADLVLVHDAARCFTPAEVFHAVQAGLETSPCVIPALAVTDTIKRVSGDQVLGTEDRDQLRAAQTPQGFHTNLLKAAIAQSTEVFTDEAALMQSAGHSVSFVTGSPLSKKITTIADLGERTTNQRTGIGSDAHRFSEDGTLVLGCLSWEGLPKLEGHSDGDSIAHAMVDAMLSAAGLGDIGTNFGVDRPEYSGASGEVFLSATLDLISASGYELVNIAVQVVADRPKIGPRRLELEQRLSRIVGAPVSIGATTTDGLGFLSDSRGVAAVATALLRARG
jgi:2-C-methyl-D-erythritol 4-phosphate cytidylyltransferase/2-C-methyl-D-erythritol 2,4-cyclodiphosphate synthase